MSHDIHLSTMMMSTRSLSVLRRLISSSPQPLKGNIILIGSPGSGKTSIGRLLASQLSMPVLDVDNDHLEPYWGMRVADKLKEVGGKGFLQAEGEALLQFCPENHVVSLSGSNPMHKPAMDHIKNTGVVVFLDVPNKDITSRLENMKVDRIVGQEAGVPMPEILQYRQQFYEKSYDIRITCEPGESLESIVRKIQVALVAHKQTTPYVSTRGGTCGRKDFADVVLQGLAEDGGLFVPSVLPAPLSIPQWERLIDATVQERAHRILERWIHPSIISPQQLSSMINKAYSSHFESTSIFPIVHLQGNQYLLELFHGPTASFKDAALQLMPQFFHSALHTKESQTGSGYLVLVATSGDTGGAVLDGFARQAASDRIKVMVLFPADGVSAIQRTQMTAMEGENIHVVGVKGDFDFCQSTIKNIFSNKAFNQTLWNNYKYKLSAANSINWGRLVPQMVYHSSSYLDLVQKGVIPMGDPVDLCIPTGNFGNILAAIYAKYSGIPIRRLICASNSNNVLTEFFQKGVYNLTQRSLHHTFSPAIDILKSSNLERYLYLHSGGDADFVRQCYSSLQDQKSFQISNQMLSDMQRDIKADFCSEEECRREIQNTFRQTGYLLDPHTAVGKVVADRHNTGDVPMIINSTAHYGKFAPEVLTALGKDITGIESSPGKMYEALERLGPRPGMHENLRRSTEKPVLHRTVLESNMNEVTAEVEAFLSRARHG